MQVLNETRTKERENVMRYLVVDTEVTNLDHGEKDLDIDSGLVYDVGGMVVDENGNVYNTFSFVNEDVFFSSDNLMESAYFKKKTATYIDELRNGKRILADTIDIYKYIRNIIAKYDVDCVCAYNAIFDVRCLNATIRYITKSQIRYFFPYKIPVVDVMKWAKVWICANKNYTLFCDTYGYKTKHKTPRNRVTAEIVYRYITGNNDFVENHTGLEDVQIETCILLYCLQMMKFEEIQQKIFYPDFKQEFYTDV